VSDLDVITACCETNAGYLALGNERFEAHGATFIRNRDTPRRHDANGVCLIRTGTETDFDALLSRVEAEYEGYSHRRFDIDPLTPPLVVARLTMLEGYKPSDLLTQLLDGDLQATPPPCDIRQVITEDDWAGCLRMDEMWWRESSTDYFGPYDPDLHAELSRSFRAKQPSVHTWMAWDDGAPRSFLSSWPGLNGIGMVEDLYTEPGYRHRGLATALLARCVADARERGANSVLINAGPAETPKQMYAALGFRPLYLSRSYTHVLETRAKS
jgi:GNAT superfamily N-acetyltransferase